MDKIPKTQISLRLPPELLERVEEAMRITGRSRSALIRRALRRELHRIEQKLLENENNE